MKAPASIYEYIKTEESIFETEEVKVYDNKNWNMRTHTQMCLMLTDGFFVNGENNWLRPFKKVIEPLLELANTAEDIEVKDITLFIKNEANKVSKFLIKKYHDSVYTKEHDLDTLIDDIAESDNKLGGALIQKGDDVPEVMKLNRIAFCDQTDILGGPIGFKYTFSPSKLRKMASQGWGQESNGANITLDELITLAQPDKDPAGMIGQKENHTTGKNIEVYIVRGDLPEAYLKDNDNMEDYYSQLHIVAYYKNSKEKRTGVTLYRMESDDEDLMFHSSKPVDGQALGKGADIFFNEQIWTNYAEIHKHKLIEAGSKVVLYTDDDGFTNRQQIVDMENLEITTVKEGAKIGQVPTTSPTEIAILENSINSWFQNAQLVGFAQDVQLGRQSFSGQTFKGQERLLQQGRGPHQRAQGKRAKFIEKVYRKYIIPQIRKEILKGKEFLATLDFSELQWVTETLAENFANKTNLELTLNGKPVEEKEILIQEFKEEFAKKGNQHLVEILKGEFKDAEIDIEIDVAGKQHDLAGMTEKVFSIFQYVFANPQGFQQLMQIPAMADSFNSILEFSNIESSDFASLMKAPMPTAEQPQGQPAQAPQAPQSLLTQPQ